MIEFVQAVSTARYSKARIALGIFLLVLVVYVLSSPGRIDIIDGQARFDVAYNWLHAGQPLLTDSLIKPWMAVAGQHGLPYSYYGAPASVLPMPLLALGGLYDGMGLGTSQFLFSLTCPILGAGIGSILFLLYIELGLSLRRALLWTIVSTFATMLWPVPVSARKSSSPFPWKCHSSPARASVANHWQLIAAWDRTRRPAGRPSYKPSKHSSKQEL